ncbi:hypothetical protein ACFSHT_00650 [Paraburkholderia silviterrae]|uniref:Uncharacterized protein n=1 Tax=Paraburkholderia silviterrae TaxID=2528715 RepID=A0A4R5MFR8_9BURK|nr:hypothetical protein [Paraburkholderia silviterrae]TDG26131.1 hypothetical protein EYW47_01875 [Paraburkholderia silviterrae]
MVLKLDSRLKAQFEHDAWQRDEVSDTDIHYSRLSGMAPCDVDVLCDFTREEALLLVIRCPKRPARYFQGKAEPKPLHIKDKSDPSTGIVTTATGAQYVSDYDLMCVWRFLGGRDYEKVFFSAPDQRLPKILTPEAQSLLDKVQWRLQAEFQHGAQDDYLSPKNPGVQMKTELGHLIDRFMVFNIGNPEYVCNGAELKQVYDSLLGKSAWPYDEGGRHHAART